MANNTQINLAQIPGDIIYTEDIGGVKIPGTKLLTGAFGVNDGPVTEDNPLPVGQALSLAGHDPILDVVKVEHRYEAATELSADGVLVSGPGFVHVLYYSCTTAGVVVIRDSITAGGGTILRTLSLPVGVGSLLMDVEFVTGLYADYDAGTLVAKINCAKR